MDVDLSPQSRALRVAQNNRTHPSALETNGSSHGIVDLYSRMVISVPIAMQFHGGPHEPTHQVEIMRRLAIYHATAFPRPGSAPGIRLVVGRLTPSEHGYN